MNQHDTRRVRPPGSRPRPRVDVRLQRRRPDQPAYGDRPRRGAYQPARNTAGPRTLELRIHGVGGAPPEVNLESPATLQVAGDGRAGFYRAWFPGGTAKGRPLQEAYCWGHLDTAWWTALWLLLLPFGLLNLAHWALPPAARGRSGTPPGRCCASSACSSPSRWSPPLSYIALDLIAWQAAGRDQLWGWLDVVRGLAGRQPDGATPRSSCTP